MTDRYHFRPADRHLPAMLLRPLQQQLAHQRPCYLWQAERFDLVVGVIAWQREPRSQSTATIAINVDPSCRGQGVGRFLLTQGLNMAREQGIRMLLAKVAFEQRPALALLRQFGFLPLLEASAQEPHESALWLGKSFVAKPAPSLEQAVINKAA